MGNHSRHISQGVPLTSIWAREWCTYLQTRRLTAPLFLSVFHLVSDCHTIPTLLVTEDELASHWADAAALINNSLSVNTRKAYNMDWNTFQVFQSLYPRSDCHNIRYLSFVAFYHSQLRLSYGTIKSYQAGIQHFLLSLQDPNRPSIFAAHLIKSILGKIQRSSPPFKQTPHHRAYIPGYVRFAHQVSFRAATQLGLQAANNISMGSPDRVNSLILGRIPGVS